MCGIILIIYGKTHKSIHPININEIFESAILKRGPDTIGFEKWITKNDIELSFTATVLWLQGKYLTKQPLHNERSIFIYNGDIFNGELEEACMRDGDTKYFYNLLNKSENIHVTLFTLQGPYAFVFYDKLKNKIFFGRDKFGRRSLLIGKSENAIILTSVAKRTKDFVFMELPSLGTFSWDLDSDTFQVYPFQHNFKNKLDELQMFLGKTFKVNNTKKLPEINFVEPNINEIGILNQIQGLSVDEAFSVLMTNSDWHGRVTKLRQWLEDAVRRRICNQPKLCKRCIHVKQSCSHASIGVLFSGGVDCSILALLANYFLEKDQPIDLFNVSFDEINGFMSPDRLTGLESLKELKALCPERIWNFNEINIRKEELDEKRDKYIADLIYPLNTILDDSLGCALWFASRGLDNSDCRVLLVGMGADELFGGYTKHRAAFKRESWLGLHNILNEDWQNLPYRNLARDDRVVSDHGRQLRTPYLDENVVSYVRSLQCWEKSFPSNELPHGFGDKILLRSLAYHLGLKNAAHLKKRALQFGSRIANKKEVANEVSERLC